MARICFYDTECNGLDVLGGFIQELAWAIYDVESRRLLKCRSALLQYGRYGRPYTVEESAYQATGLSREFCEANGEHTQRVFTEFLTDISEVEFVCGHNILDYDNKMLDTNLKRNLWNSLESVPGIKEKLFIDTFHDIPYRAGQKIFALKYLALDHGYVLTGAHQAMADVFACAHIFFQYPLDEILERARTPLVTLRAYTDYHDQEGRDRVYNNRFRWNRENKCWDKRVREFNRAAIQDSIKLDLYVIRGENEEEFISYTQPDLPFVEAVKETEPSEDPMTKRYDDHQEIPF